MTEAEWLETSRPLDLLDNGPVRPSKRQHRLIAIAACRTISSDMLGADGERWLATAEKLAYQSGISVTMNNVRCWWRDFWGVRTTRITHPNLEGMYLMVGRGESKATILNVAHLKGTAGQNYAVVDEETANVVREVMGNPFGPVTFLPEWRTSTVLALAQGMYESRDFSAMPILADALADEGCTDEAILAHYRGPGPHVRGCHVTDAILWKS